jgi:hypothetical protein
MYLDERSDAAFGISNAAGMATGLVFPTNIPTIVPPENQPPGQGVVAKGDGLIRLGSPDGGTAPAGVLIIPFGTGGAGAQFMLQLIGWYASSSNLLWGAGQAYNTKLWIPILQAQYTITLGQEVGDPQADIQTQYNFAQTIVQTYGPSFWNANSTQVDEWFLNALNGQTGMIKHRVSGARFLEFGYSLITATGANSLCGKI